MNLDNYLNDRSGFLVKESTLIYVINMCIEKDKQQTDRSGIFTLSREQLDDVIDKLDDTSGGLIRKDRLINVIEIYVNKDRIIMAT